MNAAVPASATWSAPQMASIHKMLNPRSVAVIGATPRLNYGGKFLQRVLSYRERIDVYAVNPRYPEVMGTRCYASVLDLPTAPDVAAVIVPHDGVLEALRQCHAKGVGSAIVISAGFSERGDEGRRELQREVGAFARDSGVRMSGPNCLGLANIRDDIWLTSSGRVQSGTAGPVAIVCQSGASLFGPFLARAIDYGIGLSYAVSTGNEADLEFADFARYLLDDPGTKVIAGFIEGFKDAAKFIEVARLAAERGKPIVLIKIGRSAVGAKAAGSHTAALTGSDALYDAVCKQYGVVRVQNYDELLEVAQLLARSPRPAQRGVAVVSHSGGVSSLTADMLGLRGLELPELSDAARDGIDAVLKGFGSAANPADITGKANSDEFPRIVEHLIDEPGVGTLVVASAGGDAHVEQLVALRESRDKVVAYLWTGSRAQPTGLPGLKKAGIPHFYNPDALASGLRHLLDYHEGRASRLEEGFASAPAITPAQARVAGELAGLGRATLSESESKRLISAWGVPVSRDMAVQSAEEAVAAAEHIGYPVVMKVDSPGIPHKTEAGVVRPGLRDAAQVRAAHGEIVAAARTHAPDAPISSVLVQEMVGGGIEVIVGVSYDAQLGPTLLVGTGGVLVELYGDVALRHCPIGEREARGMLADVKGMALLRGFRGRPPADVEALVAALVAVSHLAVHLEPQLAELDINPLLVLPQGRGVKAVDALAILKKQHRSIPHPAPEKNLP
jgi:acyl-CoA synthetase (NDP forming)